MHVSHVEFVHVMRSCRIGMVTENGSCHQGIFSSEINFRSQVKVLNFW
uniref:Uncharacterized protein n=1 Tax=Arundo donax TaxID=35708 RepID=A0A0A8YGU9_ARUDO